MTSFRRELLSTAADLVDGDRNVQYGDPNEDFRRTSIYWSTHLGGVLRRRLALCGYPGRDIPPEMIIHIVDDLLKPHDVAIMMTMLKQSRLAWSPEVRDHWIDTAGYAGCGWDCVVREE